MQMRTTSTIGVLRLEKGDMLMVIASTSGNVATTNVDTEVQGDPSIHYTSWIITRIAADTDIQSPSLPSTSITATTSSQLATTPQIGRTILILI